MFNRLLSLYMMNIHKFRQMSMAHGGWCADREERKQDEETARERERGG